MITGQTKVDLCAVADFAGNPQLAVVLLQHFLADGQTHSNSGFFGGAGGAICFVQAEQFAHLVIFNAYPSICNFNFNPIVWWIALGLSVNLDRTRGLIEFAGIGQ